jgi:hypothetical protein
MARRVIPRQAVAAAGAAAAVKEKGILRCDVLLIGSHVLLRK